jgi:hypothetical protein
LGGGGVASRRGDLVLLRTGSLEGLVHQAWGWSIAQRSPTIPRETGLEPIHRRIKDVLWARMTGALCPDQLPWVLLGLIAAPKEDSMVSSEELVLGVLHLPKQPATGEKVPPQLQVQG